MSCLHGGLAVWAPTAAMSSFVLLMLCLSLLCPFLFHLTFTVPLLQASYDLSLCFPSSQEWQERTPACVQPVGGRQSRRPLGLVLRPTAATATHAQSNQAGLLQEPPWAHDIPATCNRVGMSRGGKLGLESTPSRSQLPFPLCPLSQPALLGLYKSIALVQQSASG